MSFFDTIVDDTLAAALRAHIAALGYHDEDARGASQCTEPVGGLPSGQPGSLDISSFPIELLQEVFVNHPGCLARDHFFPYHSCKDDGRPCGSFCWLTVSHVCRQWRAAALQCPRLWTHIPATSTVEWTAELLQRSGAVPLHVDLDLRDSKSCESVLAQLPRIRTLRLLPNQQHNEHILELMNGSAPLLEKISISRARSSSQSDDDCAYLSALLCRERTPRLTKLSISDVGLHLLGPCSQSLKHLFVDLSQSVNRSYARTFLDAVREMPSLETITYQRHLVAPILNAPLPPSRTIQLPHLKSMRMATEAWECLTLLREMALPGLAELNVSSTVTVIYGPLLVDAIAQNIPNIAELATLNVSRYPTYVRVATGPKDMLFPSDGLRFSLDVSMRYCLANDSDRIISSLTLLQPLRGARHLVVDGACMSESSWSAIFEGMDDVTRLSVSGSEAAEKLPLALARRRHTLDTVRQSLEPQDHLPSLRSLELTRVHFGDKETLRVGTLSGFAADFRASLAIRARHGRKLDELRIVRGINLHQGMVNAFRNVVGLVSHDGLQEDRRKSTWPWDGFSSLFDDMDSEPPSMSRYQGSTPLFWNM